MSNTEWIQTLGFISISIINIHIYIYTYRYVTMKKKKVMNLRSRWGKEGGVEMMETQKCM